MVSEAKRKHLLAKCQELLEITESSGLMNLTKDVRNTVETAMNEQFIITVIGEFSRGKSTLVNAILKSDLIPTGVVPTTATLNIIHYSEKPFLRIHKRDGNTSDLPVKKESLSAFKASSGFEPKNVKYAEIGFPIDYLKDGTVVVDTPGVNDINEQRLNITYGYIPVSDAVIVVMDANTPFKSTEQSFLTQHVLCHDICKVFIVLNKADELESQDLLADSVSYVNENLARMEFTKPPKVFSLSAKKAFLAQAANDEEDLANSGWVDFEKELKEFVLSGERTHARIDKLDKQLQRHCTQVIEELNIQIFRQSESIDQLKKELRKLSSLSASWASKLKALEDYVDQCARNLDTAIQSSLGEKQEELLETLTYQLNMQRGSLEDFAENTVPFVLKKSIKQWWESSGSRIAKDVDIIQTKTLRAYSQHFSKKPIMQLVNADYKDWLKEQKISSDFRGDDAALGAAEKPYKIGGAIAGVAAAILIGSNPLYILTLPIMGSGMASRLLGTKQVQKKLDEQKREMKVVLRRELKRVFLAYSRIIREQVDKTLSQFKNELRSEFRNTLQELENDTRKKIDQRKSGLGRETEQFRILQESVKAAMSILGE